MTAGSAGLDAGEGSEEEGCMSKGNNGGKGEGGSEGEGATTATQATATDSD